MAITPRYTKGFTLIEIILGIVVMSIAIAGVVSVMASFDKTSTDPILDTKASMLAEHVISQIYQTSYDENSDHYGGECRCGENSILCPSQAVCSNIIGPDNDLEKNALSPLNFNDVDDFDSSVYCSSHTSSIVCQKNEAICEGNDACLLPAEFFTTSEFTGWIEEQLKLFDIAYNGFYVYIKVNTTTNSKDGLNSIIEATNNSDIYAQVKHIELKVLVPNGQVYTFSMIRGNY